MTILIIREIMFSPFAWRHKLPDSSYSNGFAKIKHCMQILKLCISRRGNQSIRQESSHARLTLLACLFRLGVLFVDNDACIKIARFLRDNSHVMIDQNLPARHTHTCSLTPYLDA